MAVNPFHLTLVAGLLATLTHEEGEEVAKCGGWGGEKLRKGKGGGRRTKREGCTPNDRWTNRWEMTSRGKSGEHSPLGAQEAETAVRCHPPQNESFDLKQRTIKRGGVHGSEEEEQAEMALATVKAKSIGFQ